MKYILFISMSAHAGILDWCAKQLIADDPYQFESASDEWLDQQISRLQIKAAWGKLGSERGIYEIMLKEKEGRGPVEPAHEDKN